MRPLVILPKVGELTQGAIFNCLRINNGANAFGLIVSARCDIVQSKCRTILCLPIFPLKRWMEEVGNAEVLDQAGKQIESISATLVEKYGMAGDSLEVYGFDAVIAVLMNKNVAKGDLDRLTQFKPYLVDKKLDFRIKAIKDAHSKILDLLWRNQRADTHFIERIHPNEQATGYVIDFNQPITQYREVLDEISLGLERYIYERGVDGKYSNLDLGQLDQGEIVSILQSPFIEHVLQRFTHYYSRIGTKDISKEDLKNLKGIYEIS